MAMPDSIPAHIDLSDNGATLGERMASGDTVRAHERAGSVMAQALMAQALIEANQQDWRFPAISDE
jgi:hypothetical protein